MANYRLILPLLLPDSELYWRFNTILSYRPALGGRIIWIGDL